MRHTSNFWAVGLTVAAVAQAELDIPALLASLGPAPASDPRFTNWVAPGPGDVRSPCPGLNTLANHGFINHDGKNLTIPELLVGLASGMNIGADFTVVIGALGLLSAPEPLEGYFDLDWLDQHNFPIEHDASLSRRDAYFGNDYSFYNPNWQTVLSYYDGLTKTTTPQASKARYARVKDSLTNDPDVTYGLEQFILSSGETGLYIQTMNNPVDNSAPLSYVKSLFEEEKLPFEQGWRPSAEPITLLSLGEYLLELFADNPDNVAEGATLTAMSYKDIITNLVGGSEVLANLTQGISTDLGL